MNLLLDTHAFAWLLDGDARLPASARALIASADLLHLSAASVWEGEIKRASGQLTAPPFVAAARRVAVPVLAVTADHAEAAAHLPPIHRDPFDRMLVAQARIESLVIVTKDREIGRYGVPTVW